MEARARSKIGAVLLAAGRGLRFGPEPKLLAPFEGKPLVRHAAEAALASRAHPVVVVLGAHSERVRAALDGLALRTLDNPDHADGLSTSLRLGLSALPDAAEAAIVLLADMPRIGPHHLDALIEAYEDATPRPTAVIPTYRGRRGNPVLLDHRRLATDLATLSGDRGAGALLKARADVLEIEADAAVAFDVDTPDSLASVV